MKILHLDGSSEDNGGVLSVLRNLQAASAPHGLQHVVWVNDKFTERRSPALDYRRSPHACGDDASHCKLFLQAWRAFPEVKRLLAEEKFGLVHAHTRGALLLAVKIAARLGRPVVFTNHNYARRRWLYSWAAARPRVHTVLLTPNMARHYGMNIDPPRMNMISEACADDFFTAPLAERTTGKVLRFVGVGSLVRWKNWHLVIEALALLNDAERERIRCRLWGPVPNEPAAQAYAGELRRSVKARGLEAQFEFCGPTNSIREALTDADWFVLPSTNEPCSVALIEALALGLPAIVSNSGGSPDIVQDERTGLLFTPESPASLAARLRQILAGKAEMPPPENIRASVRARSASVMSAEYAALYRQILAAPAPPPAA
ncbi:MAG: glycosyltransferase family 4 protein [Verrucomicrobia bacterium]|nr:glycosyltransferase family 4 protein [Verrucomicrobiota bacterium]